MGSHVHIAISEGSGEVSERDGRRLVEDVIQLAFMLEQVVERGNTKKPTLPAVLDRLDVRAATVSSDEVLDPSLKNPLTCADVRDSNEAIQRNNSGDDAKSSPPPAARARTMSNFLQDMPVNHSAK